MTDRIADDFAAINSRMEQIKQERINAPIEHAMQSAVENYMAGGVATHNAANVDMPYLGWDIYGPVNVSNGS